MKRHPIVSAARRTASGPDSWPLGPAGLPVRRAWCPSVVAALVGMVFLLAWDESRLHAAEGPYSNWMRDHWSQIQGKTLRQLVIPGTHDSGAYDLVSPWEIFDPRYYQIAKEAFNGEDFAAGDVRERARDYINAGEFFEHWATTQDNTIREQLEDGIRALDIRVALDTKDVFRVAHSLYGDTLKIVLQDIATFLDSHPDELVYLRFDAFHDYGLRTPSAWEGGAFKMRRAKHEELLKQIRGLIGDRLIRNWRPDVPLSSLRAPDSKRRILLFYSTARGAVAPDLNGSVSLDLRDDFINSDEFVASFDWVNPSDHKGEPTTFKTLTRQSINLYRNDTKAMHRLGAVTPTDDQFDAWYQGGEFGGSNPRTLAHYADDTNPVLAGWIQQDWANLDLNIIHMDFYPDYLVPLCLRLNGITVPDFTIPENDDWGNYQTLAEIFREAYDDAVAWTETAVTDVEDWFEGAWSDVTAFFNSVADGFEDIFYETVYPDPKAGTSPAGGVKAGVRHYVVTADSITATTTSGDAGNNLEIYGELFMVPSPFCSTDPGSNRTFWSATESDARTLGLNLSLAIGHSKNLYVPEAQAVAARVAVGGALVENDDSLFPGLSDDFAQAQSTVPLGNFAEGESRTVTVDVDFGGDQIVRVTFTVERRVAPLIPQQVAVAWSDLNYGAAVTPVEIDRRLQMGSGPLGAKAQVPGSFQYRPELNEFLQPGAKVIVTASFTPTDTRRYAGRTVTREVTVRPVNRPIPGRVQAEDFDVWRGYPAGTIPAVSSTNDTDGGQQVVMAAQFNRLGYDITVAQAGVYLPALRAATAAANSQIMMFIDGQTQTSQHFSGLAVPILQTGATTFATTTLPALYLSEGRHRIEFLNVSGAAIFLNYLDFSAFDIEFYRPDFNAFPDGAHHLGDGSHVQGGPLLLERRPFIDRQEGGLVLLQPFASGNSVISAGNWYPPPLSRTGSAPTEFGFAAQFTYKATGTNGYFNFRYGDLAIFFNRPGAGSSFEAKLGTQTLPGGLRAHSFLADDRSCDVVIGWTKGTGEGRLTLIVQDDDNQSETIFENLPTPGFDPTPETRMALSGVGSSAPTPGQTLTLLIENFELLKLSLLETRVLDLVTGANFGRVTVVDGRVGGVFVLGNRGTTPLTIHSFILPQGVSLDWTGGVLQPGEEREIALVAEGVGLGATTWTVRAHSNATQDVDESGHTLLEFRAEVVAAPVGLSDVTVPGDPVVIVDGENDDDPDAGPSPDNEGVARAIDDMGLKYLNFLDLNSGLVVTPALGLTVVQGLRLYPANDWPDRDPASFRLEGSVEGPDGPFTVIAGGPLSLPLERNLLGTTALNPATSPQQTVYFENAVAYRSYRLVFPTLRAAAADNSMQIAEVEFLGSPAEPEPPDMSFTLEEYRDRVGQTFQFEVTGVPDGMIWGTDIYTDDTPLAVAAVHAGVLAPGQPGTVTVTILPPQPIYLGSTRNGIVSHPSGPWGGSYSFLLPEPATPRHRYSFATDGTDSIGGAHATLVGTAQVVDGQLNLPGGGPRTHYAFLPASVGTGINSVSAVTFEAWFTTHTAQNWSKLFYFGQDAGGFATESLEFTPLKGDNTGFGKAESLDNNIASNYHTALTYSETGVEIHLVVVFDSENGVIAVYKNGELDGEGVLTRALAEVALPELFLGAAVGWGDPDFNGRLNEFRIYDQVLSAEEVAASWLAGPDMTGGPPPVPDDFEITNVSAPTGSLLNLTFPTQAGLTYQVETSTTLVFGGVGGWTHVGPPITGTGTPATFTDNVNGVPSTMRGIRFYRVKVITP